MLAAEATAMQNGALPRQDKFSNTANAQAVQLFCSRAGDSIHTLIGSFATGWAKLQQTPSRLSATKPFGLWHIYRN
jgi:hypothetical protein